MVTRASPETHPQAIGHAVSRQPSRQAGPWRDHRPHHDAQPEIAKDREGAEGVTEIHAAGGDTMKSYIVVEKRTKATFLVQVVAADLGPGDWKAIPIVYKTHAEALKKMNSRHDTVCGKCKP